MRDVISPFETKLKGVFRRVVAARWWIIAIYALLLPPSAEAATISGSGAPPTLRKATLQT